MACELPPVVSDAGGFGEVVDSQNGRIVPLYDTAEFVQTILALAANPSLRSELGRKSRQTVVDKFSSQNLASQMIELLQIESQKPGI
jgi:glycosyltransferase involved in cell wall biosynthesis